MKRAVKLLAVLRRGGGRRDGRVAACRATNGHGGAAGIDRARRVSHSLRSIRRQRQRRRDRRPAARAGLQFIILTDHGDGTRSPDAPAYRSGVLTIDGVELNTTGGHYAAIGPSGVAVSARGNAGRCDRGRASAWRLRHCRASGLAAAVAELAGWDTAFDGLEWINGDSEWRDEPRTPIARALLDLPAARPAVDGDAARSARQRVGAWDALAAQRQVVGLAGSDAHARLGFRQRTDPDAVIDPRAAAGLRGVVPRLLESCRPRRAVRR